ncbi:MAG: hypothetical protein M3Y28_01065 [Armatimonadota bacterium]|nr:hypothetical protein [Armatimonadota bacterium]
MKPHALLILPGLLLTPALSHAKPPTAAKPPISIPRPPVPAPPRPAVALQGDWQGMFRQSGLGKFPMQMRVQSVTGSTFVGEMHWPTLQDSKTVISGQIKGRTLTWTETKLLQGGSIILHGKYVAHWDAKGGLTGTWTRPGRTRSEGTFTLTRTDAPPAPTPIKN